jgi:virulence factor Mce-like protein
MINSRKALQGLAFVAVMVALISLAVAKYTGAFTAGVPVTLEVAAAGTQLSERADVKVRGLVVGKVEQVTSDGAGATIHMTLDPDKVDLIPENVTARLLPKTLFGEKFVSLVPPQVPSTARLGAGDVIGQDRSQTAREVDQALDDLLPVLQAVKPQELATTLGALSQGLNGRGEELGQTLVSLNTLVKGINPSVPALQDDLGKLATFSNNLADAAPDLLSALDDLTVTSRTIADQRQNLLDVYDSVTGASDDLRGFLDSNGDNLISLASSGRPTLETLARYSPEVPCFLKQLDGLIPRADAVFGKGTKEPGVHVTIEIVDNQGKYLPGQDEPEYADDRGPRCYPIIDPGPQFAPDGPFRDGSTPPPPPVGQPVGSPEAFGADDFGTYHGDTSWNQEPKGAPKVNEPTVVATPASWKGVDMGLPNSPAEQQMVATLIAAQNGTTSSAVPSWSSVLVGPLYRGTEVSLT